MDIGIVGGIERGWTDYQRLAARHGHRVELHGGHVQGRGGEALESLVRRSDVILLVTGINSHAAVQQARRLVAKHGRRLLILKSCGVSRFAQVLDALDGRTSLESYAKAG